VESQKPMDEKKESSLLLDQHQDIDVYYTEKTMQLLSSMLETSYDNLPKDFRMRFDNALMNIAVNRILEVEGSSVTATFLWRIADALQSGLKPTPDNPIENTTH
jgi:hypothetical protein